MCGRYNLRTPLTVLSQRFLFDLPPDVLVSPRYNIASTQSVVTVRQPATSEKRELALMHWGLIPRWAKDAKIASSLINARSETLAEKPAFRAAFARRRCLILADGFYEWKKEGKQKLPFCFELASQQPFALAGLWERWRGPEGSEGPPLESCTIVTTTANDLCRPLHERMPVILEPADYDIWLDPAQNDPQQLQPLLAPFPANEMQSRPVNPRVNNVKNDDPDVLIAEQSLF